VIQIGQPHFLLKAMLTELDPTLAIRLNMSNEAVSVFCQKWGIVSMALFGSVLRSDFSQDSDIDFLIAFNSETRQGLLTLARVKHELEFILKHSVDIAVKASIEGSDNWIRRHEILTTARTIYEQR
jgi:uncharacterized protein